MSGEDALPAASRIEETDAARAYVRLLRWYPPSWRERHGEILLGTLLDAAEAAGRRRPGAAEAWMLRLTGLGERLTARLAVVCASIAVALSAGATLLALGGVAGPNTAAYFGVQALAVPALSALAFFALLGAATALPVAVFFGWGLILVLPFLVPVLALVVLIVLLSRRRAPRPLSADAVRPPAARAG